MRADLQKEWDHIQTKGFESMYVDLRSKTVKEWFVHAFDHIENADGAPTFE